MGRERQLYFDYNATTPVAPEVFEAMVPFLKDCFGNPGCGHRWGMDALEAVRQARARVAGLIGADPENIVFTSCATESNNMVVLGAFDKPEGSMVTSKVEHPAILCPARELEKQGVDLRLAEVGRDGRVDPGEVENLISDDTRLVSIMLANNEVGAIQPVAEIATMARAKGAAMHTDAAQAVGKVPLNVDDLGVDYLTIAGHKIYAPKGIGAVYARDPERLRPMFFGGGQEQAIRPGTENVAYMVALGAACELAGSDLEQKAEQQREMGERLLASLDRGKHPYMLHAPETPRLPGTYSIGFKNLRADRIMEGLVLREVGVSTGAACHSGEVGVSSVLKAMDAPLEYAMGTIRFSLGRYTTPDDVDELVHRLNEVLDEVAAES